MRWRWLIVPAALALVAVILRLWFLGLYTVPAESISMAPTLIPAPEGGDALVLASLYVGWSSPPDRRVPRSTSCNAMTSAFSRIRSAAIRFAAVPFFTLYDTTRSRRSPSAPDRRGR